MHQLNNRNDINQGTVLFYLIIVSHPDVFLSDPPAWSSHAPSFPPSLSPTTTTSFAAIQEQQAAKPILRGPVKTLKEIQDEEQEAAFLLWFEQESVKVQKQEALLNSNEPSTTQESPTKVANRRGRGQGSHRRGGRHASGRGGGRGRGREREGQPRNLPEAAHT